MSDRTEAQDWPLRPWLLAGMVGIAGLLIYHIGGGQGPDTRVGWQAAVTAQLGMLQHTSNLYYSAPCAVLASMLCEMTGMSA